MPKKTTPVNDFKPYPGMGYLFRAGGTKEHPIFQGHVNIADTKYQLVGHYDHAKSAYELDLREFGPTWKHRTHLTLGKPRRLGDMRKTKIELDDKKYTFEASIDITKTNRPCLRIRVPEAIVKPNKVY